MPRDKFCSFRNLLLPCELLETPGNSLETPVEKAKTTIVVERKKKEDVPKEKRKIDKLKHDNKLRTLTLPYSTQVSYADYTQNCSVCTNLIKTPKSSIPCPSCKHLVHKKCSNLNPNQLLILKKTLNIWECLNCTKKFPFSEMDDEEIHLDAVNSNWSNWS